MLDDLQFALRSLLRRPGVTLVAALCLGLGVGANTVLFGVVDALLFRPPSGIEDAEQLVRVRVGSASEGALARFAGSAATFPHYQTIREQQAHVLTGLAAYAGRALTLGAGPEAEPLSGLIVSSNYFAVLGVRPRLGRFFAADEDAAPGAGAVTVLSYDFWARKLNFDRGVLGQAIRVNGVQLTVIGVAPAGFVGTDLGSTDLWIPMSMAVTDAFGNARHRTAAVGWLQMVGRLRPGLDRERARASLFRGDAIQAAVPVSFSPLTTMFFADQAGTNPVPVWVLGITAAVLLLACATVANLLLAEAARRDREISIRLAVGATRTRIVRQLLAENGIIAIVSALLAILFGWWSLGLVRLLPVPAIAQLIDARAVVFALALAAVTVLFFGLAPALWASRQDVAELLKQTGSRSTGGRFLVQRGLTSVQIAITFVLLVCAGLFLSSLRNLKAMDLGFDADRVLTASIDRRARRMTGPEAAVFYETVLSEVRAVRGVASASIGSMVPFYSFSRYGFQIQDGRPDDMQPISVLTNAVEADYFRTLGLTLLQGRQFSAEDASPGSPRVALVSERLARDFWPNTTPVGACLIMPRSDEPCIRVLGVVRDAKLQDLRGEPTPILYLSSARAVLDGITFTVFVRAEGKPAGIAGAVRRAIQSVDRSMPFVKVELLDARIRPSRIPWEVAASLFTVFGALAALLASGGMFSVISFIVSQRTRELGIRVALGATRASILRLVLRRALELSGIGIAAGAVIALWVSRLFANRMVGISPAEPLPYLAVSVGLAGIALLASSIPSLRAARTDPVRALRADG